MKVMPQKYRDFDNINRCDLIEITSGLPYCFYITAHLRTDYPVYKTARAAAYQAKYYLSYFKKHGIDIVERVESGAFLTKQECEDFFLYAKYKLDSAPNPSTNITPIDINSHKGLDKLIFATRQTQNHVTAASAKFRLSALQRFIEFLFACIHEANNVPPDVDERYQDTIARFKKEKKRLKAQNDVVKDIFEQAIPTPIYFKMLDITKPSSKDNPWGKQSRLRNHIIVQLFNEAGIRNGALCKLKISDLKTDGRPRIMITRTPNDPTDPRIIPATQKTLAHTSPISHDLMQNILLYIETDRAKYDDAKTHDFIFISEKGDTKGQPLALQSVNYLFRKLSKKLEFEIHPHLMRHKFQEIFDDAAVKCGYQPDKINDLRRQACGWVPGSSMVEVYNAFKNAVAGAEISAQAQKDMLAGLEELQPKPHPQAKTESKT